MFLVSLWFQFFLTLCGSKQHCQKVQSGNVETLFDYFAYFHFKIPTFNKNNMEARINLMMVNILRYDAEQQFAYL